MRSSVASLIYIASFRQQEIYGKTWGKGEKERISLDKSPLLAFHFLVWLL